MRRHLARENRLKFRSAVPTALWYALLLGGCSTANIDYYRSNILPKYEALSQNKALAGGGYRYYSWIGGQSTPELARERALGRCTKDNIANCHVYLVNDTVETDPLAENEERDRQHNADVGGAYLGAIGKGLANSPGR